jgi:hypothetical protein
MVSQKCRLSDYHAAGIAVTFQNTYAASGAEKRDEMGT